VLSYYVARVRGLRQILRREFSYYQNAHAFGRVRTISDIAETFFIGIFFP